MPDSRCEPCETLSPLPSRSRHRAERDKRVWTTRGAPANGVACMTVAPRPTLDDLLAVAVGAVPGGVTRPGQQEMAAAVEAATRDGEHLLVQAGTGTGKSLAYLVPALL